MMCVRLNSYGEAGVTYSQNEFDPETFERKYPMCFNMDVDLFIVPVNMNSPSDMVFILTPATMRQAPLSVSGFSRVDALDVSGLTDVTVRVFFMKHEDDMCVHRLVFSRAPVGYDNGAIIWEEPSHCTAAPDTITWQNLTPDAMAVQVNPPANGKWDASIQPLLLDDPTDRVPAPSTMSSPGYLVECIHADILKRVEESTLKIVTEHVARLKRLHSAIEQSLARVGSPAFIEDVMKRVRTSLEASFDPPENKA